MNTLLWVIIAVVAVCAVVGTIYYMYLGYRFVVAFKALVAGVKTFVEVFRKKG